MDGWMDIYVLPPLLACLLSLARLARLLARLLCLLALLACLACLLACLLACSLRGLRIDFWKKIPREIWKKKPEKYVALVDGPATSKSFHNFWWKRHSGQQYTWRNLVVLGIPQLVFALRGHPPAERWWSHLLQGAGRLRESEGSPHHSVWRSRYDPAYSIRSWQARKQERRRRRRGEGVAVAPLFKI